LERIVSSMSLKELKRQNRAQLWEKEELEYPKGRFQLQLRSKRMSEKTKIPWEKAVYRALRVCALRPDSCYSNAGVAHAESIPEKSQRDLDYSYFNNSFGYVRTYDTLEKLLKAARAHGYPEDFIKAFVQKYEIFDVSGLLKIMRDRRKAMDQER